MNKSVVSFYDYVFFLVYYVNIIIHFMWGFWLAFMKKLISLNRGYFSYILCSLLVITMRYRWSYFRVAIFGILVW